MEHKSISQFYLESFEKPTAEISHDEIRRAVEEGGEVSRFLVEDAEGYYRNDDSRGWVVCCENGYLVANNGPAVFFEDAQNESDAVEMFLNSEDGCWDFSILDDSDGTVKVSVNVSDSAAPFVWEDGWERDYGNANWPEDQEILAAVFEKIGRNLSKIRFCDRGDNGECIYELE
jgi:hypothetical protein